MVMEMDEKHGGGEGDEKEEKARGVAREGNREIMRWWDVMEEAKEHEVARVNGDEGNHDKMIAPSLKVGRYAPFSWKRTEIALLIENWRYRGVIGLTTYRNTRKLPFKRPRPTHMDSSRACTSLVEFRSAPEIRQTQKEKKGEKKSGKKVAESLKRVGFEPASAGRAGAGQRPGSGGASPGPAPEPCRGRAAARVRSRVGTAAGPTRLDTGTPSDAPLRPPPPATSDDRGRIRGVGRKSVLMREKKLGEVELRTDRTGRAGHRQGPAILRSEDGTNKKALRSN